MYDWLLLKIFSLSSLKNLERFLLFIYEGSKSPLKDTSFLWIGLYLLIFVESYKSSSDISEDNSLESTVVIYFKLFTSSLKLIILIYFLIFILYT